MFVDKFHVTSFYLRVVCWNRDWDWLLLLALETKWIGLNDIIKVSLEFKQIKMSRVKGEIVILPSNQLYVLYQLLDFYATFVGKIKSSIFVSWGDICCCREIYGIKKCQLALGCMILFWSFLVINHLSC